MQDQARTGASFCFTQGSVQKSGPGNPEIAGRRSLAMVNPTSQCREVKGLWVLLAAILCAFAPTISLAAQDQQPCAPEKNFTKAGHLLERKDFQGAKVVLRRLEACPHLSPLQRFNLGWLYGKAQDFPDALKVFKSVQPNVPDQLTHGYAIALVHFDQGQYQAAIDILTALRSKGISDAKCADLIGVAYSKLGRYQEAYTVMVENLRRDSSNPSAYYNLITLFVDTGELDKAAQVADKAVVAVPENAEALSMRGSIELSQGKTEHAYRDFASAAQLSPGAPDPPFFMALAEYRQSKFEEAGQILRNAIASGIADSDLHYLLAECLIRIDATDSVTVLSELDRAIQLNPNSVSARVLRGEKLLQSGRPHDALVDLKIARELEPNPQRDARNTTYLLARAYVAVGKQEEAKILFAQLSPHFSSDKADTLTRLSDHKMQAALHR
jgi:tetratricopeptide (TPR) repeat protein